MANRLIQISPLAVIKKSLIDLRERDDLINLFERHSFAPRPGFDPYDTKRGKRFLVASYLDECDWSDLAIVTRLLGMAGEVVRWNSDEYLPGDDPRRDRIIEALAAAGYTWTGRAFTGPAPVALEADRRSPPTPAESTGPGEAGGISMNPVKENVLRLLEAVLPEDEDRVEGFEEDWFTERTGLRGRELGAAASFLEDRGAVLLIRASGDGPADMGTMHLKPRALELYYELKAEQEEAMRQHQPAGEHASLPRLRVSREEAAASIREQIAEGERILKLPVRSPVLADAARREREGWTTVTADILQTLTDSPSLPLDFTGPPAPKIVGSMPFRAERATEWHQKEVGDRLSSLHTLLKRLHHFRDPLPDPVASGAAPGLHTIFGEGSFTVDPDFCFVLMPFGRADLQEVFAQQVRPTLTKQCKLRVERADDIYDVRPIVHDVWAGINRARLIVAELTDRNPNVLYELGISHTLGKDTILLTQTMADVPFDLHHRRVIEYTYTPPGCKKLRAALKKTALAVLGRKA
jgi:hypothetical protein